MPANDNHTSTTQFTMAHRLSNHDRSYTRLLVTPPSPPYSSTPPEYRRLKEDMVLRWVNYQLGCTPAVTRLADICNHDAFVKLIHIVSSQHCPRQRSTKSTGTSSYQAAASMLKDWIGHDSGYNLETLVRDDPDQLLSFILTQHQAHIIHKIQSTFNTFIIPKVRYGDLIIEYFLFILHNRIHNNNNHHVLNHSRSSKCYCHGHKHA